MKRALLVSLLVFVAINLAGCFVVVGNTQKCPPDCSKDPEVAATIAEINAVSKLHSEFNRLAAYKTIAARPDLRPKERIHLMDAINKNLNSEFSRQQVLMILLKNRPQPAEDVALTEDCEPSSQNEL